MPAPIGDHVDDLLAGWDELDACLGAGRPRRRCWRRPATCRAATSATAARPTHRALFGSLALPLLRSEDSRDRWLVSLGLDEVEVAALRGLEIPRPGARVGDHPALAAEAAFTATAGPAATT